MPMTCISVRRWNAGKIAHSVDVSSHMSRLYMSTYTMNACTVAVPLFGEMEKLNTLAFISAYSVEHNHLLCMLQQLVQLSLARIHTIVYRCNSIYTGASVSGV